jgi:calcium-dependent protein kinase
MKGIRKNAVEGDEKDKIFTELGILKLMDHPNIMRIYEMFQDEMNYYIITEYLSGGELFDKIKTLKFFSEKMAAEYMR